MNKKINMPNTCENPLIDPIHERISAVDKDVILHPALHVTIQGILECASRSAVSREPCGAVLTGIGGTGKTTACDIILKKFPSSEVERQDRTVRIIPAFYTTVPSPSSIKSLASNILISLGDPAPLAGSAAAMTKRLADLLKICETKMILLDEFHHLLNERGNNQIRSKEVCDWVKSLINRTGVMVCLVGLPSCETLVNFDEQMSRRFAYRYRLAPLVVGTEKDRGPICGYLVSMSKVITDKVGLDGGVNFRDFLHVVQVWAATKGNPSFISLLLKEATSIALHGGRSTVTVGDLADAFDKGVTVASSMIQRNPFVMSRNQLASALGTIELM